MDFDHLCTPMRGQPEMTPPEALTLPGATAAYIAKLEARGTGLEAELAGWRDGVFVHPDHADAAPSAFLWYIEKLERRIAVLEGERDDMRQLLGEVADQREKARETIRRLADELASYKAAFIDLGIEMRSFGFVDCWHDGAQEVAPHSGDATARAFSAPALMSGPYMGDD